MKMWEEHPIIWRLLIDIGILLKYKTLKIDKLPNKVVLPSSTVIYVNSNENRGRALLISGGITQNRLFYFWEKSIETWHPDLVIDVGVNYGECIFSTSYPEHTKIYGVEANHHLLEYINRSKEKHPNNRQITIIHALASDKEDEQKEFYIDQHWSGTSSASYMPSHNRIEMVAVRTITIDSLFAHDMTSGKVLFKVDVEGYEAFVLNGMSELLKKCDSAIGFIEFDSEYIEKSGIAADEFFMFLQENFTIYIYIEDDTLLKANSIKYENLQIILGSSYIHTDMILLTNEEMIGVYDFSLK